MIAGLTIAAFSALAVAIFVATLTQRLSGQGLGMVGAPVVAIIAPEHLPSTVLILGLLIGAGAISLDVSAINWREARPGLAGRAVGGFIGAGIAALVIDPDLFAVIVAIIRSILPCSKNCIRFELTTGMNSTLTPSLSATS